MCEINVKSQSDSENSVVINGKSKDNKLLVVNDKTTSKLEDLDNYKLNFEPTGEANYSEEDSKSNNSLVFKTLTDDCSLSNFSSDQIRQFDFIANARYCTSLVCSGNNFNAFGMNSLNSSLDINLILLSKIEINLENSCSERYVFDKISCLFLENSINKNSGAINSLSEKSMASDFFVPLINRENNSLTSTTINIYASRYLLDNLSLTSFPNLRASCFVSLLFDLNSFKNSKSAIFCKNASLATADQFISLNSINFSFNSFGIDKVMFSILDNNCIQINYVDTLFKFFGSGNWDLNCGDYCNITSAVDVLGNNISITDAGKFKIDGVNITNYNNLHIRGTDSSNLCEVYCLNGGCFISLIYSVLKFFSLVVVIFGFLEFSDFQNI